MKRILQCVIAAGVIVAAASGCAPMAVPVVKQSLTCDVSSGLLQACGDGVAIKPGITFGEMIEVSRRDRQTLEECARNHKDLAAAVARCKETVDKHNAGIREDEAREAAKR